MPLDEKLKDPQIRCFFIDVDVDVDKMFVLLEASHEKSKSPKSRFIHE